MHTSFYSSLYHKYNRQITLCGHVYLTVVLICNKCNNTNSPRNVIGMFELSPLLTLYAIHFHGYSPIDIKISTTILLLTIFLLLHFCFQVSLAGWVSIFISIPFSVCKEIFNENIKENTRLSFVKETKIVNHRRYDFFFKSVGVKSTPSNQRLDNSE